MRKFLTRFFVCMPIAILIGSADSIAETFLVAVCLISFGIASGFFALESESNA